MEPCFLCQDENSIIIECSHRICKKCLCVIVKETWQTDPYKTVTCPNCDIMIEKKILYEVMGGIQEYSRIHNGYEKFDCPLCYQEQRIHNSTYTGCTDHLYCTPCLKMFVEEKVKSVEFDKGISCPECEFLIDDQVLREVLPPSEYQVYKKILNAKSEYTKTEVQIYRWCLYCQKCTISSNDQQAFFCKRCNKLFCMKCKEEVHQGPCEAKDLELDQVRTNEILNQSVPEGLMPCPICKNAVALEKGCNAIRCPWINCRNTIFCMLCGMVLDIKEHFSHYTKEGPFGKTCNTLDREHLNDETCGQELIKMSRGEQREMMLPSAQSFELAQRATRWKCESCEIFFKSSENLISHQGAEILCFEEKGENPYSKPTKSHITCKFCGDKFESSHSLQLHIGRKHNKIKNVFCSICFKWFLHKYALTSHMNYTHLKSKTAVCKYCKSEYYNKHIMMKHVKKCKARFPKPKERSP